MAVQNKKNQTLITRQNVVESIKDLGGGAASQTADFIKDTSADFIRELLGLPKTNIKRSGELTQGQQIEINDVLSGKEEKRSQAQKQINFERRLLEEESATSLEKGRTLKIQLQAVMQEVQKVAQSTENLAENTQVSMLSAPVEPGVYHVRFFENLLTFLRSFRERIDLASTWMESANKRAEKKNYWATYKKNGSSFLLSPDHYLSRSAG